jgi:hypothetical protein
MANVGPENQPIYDTIKVLNVATSSTPAAISSAKTSGLVCLRARKSNTAPIGIGDSTLTVIGTSYQLEPGESTPWLPINDLSKIFVVSAAAQVLEVLYM